MDYFKHLLKLKKKKKEEKKTHKKNTKQKARVWADTLATANTLFFSSFFFFSLLSRDKLYNSYFFQSEGMSKFICAPIHHQPYISSWMLVDRLQTPKRPSPWGTSVPCDVKQLDNSDRDTPETADQQRTHFSVVTFLPVHWQQFKSSFPGRTWSYHSDRIDYSHGLHRH